MEMFGRSRVKRVAVMKTARSEAWNCYWKMMKINTLRRGQAQWRVCVRALDLWRVMWSCEWGI